MGLMTKAIEILRAAFEGFTEMSDEDLRDVVQDVVTAEALGGAAPSIGVDTARDMALNAGIPIGESDGVLLILFKPPRGDIEPHVVKLGLMTEGRLEAAMMTIFSAINRARALQYQRDELQRRQQVKEPANG